MFGLAKQHKKTHTTNDSAKHRKVVKKFSELPEEFTKIVSEQKRVDEIIDENSVQSFVVSDYPVLVYNSLRDEDLELIYEDKAIVWQLLDSDTQSHIGAQLLFNKLQTEDVGLNTLVMRRNILPRYFLHFIQLEMPKSLKYYYSGKWKDRA